MQKLLALLARSMGPDERHGLLPPILLLITIVTGVVDAVSYLKLGHVFVANMTGNVVFLGFAVADAEDFSIPASLAAIVFFLLGALAGGALGKRLGGHRGKLVSVGLGIEILLVGGAFAVSLPVVLVEGAAQRYALIAALALAMGLQNAVARRLAVPDLTTTVLTLTLTGLAADSHLAGGKNPFPRRRLLATFAMFLGAAIGALLLLHFGAPYVLGLALLLLLAAAVLAVPQAFSSEPWTAG